MKSIIATTLMVFAPFVAFAGGHSTLGGSGTGVRIDLKTIEGTSGTHVQVTTSDIWMYDNPPEGFPKATSATCSQFIAFAMGQEQPVGGSFTCQVVDVDGDVALQSGALQPDGTALITQVAGTGKWTAFVGTQLIGKTDIQVDAKTSTYSWTATN